MYEGAEGQSHRQVINYPDVGLMSSQKNIFRPAAVSKEADEQVHPFQELLYSLRTEGIKASTSEWLDLQRCLAEGQVQSVDDLYLVARSLLVKDVSRFAAFDRVFEKVFYSKSKDDQQKQEERDDEEMAEQDSKEETIQKEREYIEDVAQATSGTSEDMHGGSEATKDIAESPNAADSGMNFSEKGGRGKKKRKSKKERSGKASGEERFSARQRIVERRYDTFDNDTLLHHEQFNRVLEKLTTIIRDETPARTSQLDQQATVRRIAQRSGMPEFVWKEEVEEKPRVLVLVDVGGTTDEFLPMIKRLLTAAKDTMSELQICHFHNAIYGEVWPQKDGNYPERPVPLDAILKEDPSTKVVVVGDAKMGDYDEMYGGLYDSFYDIYKNDGKQSSSNTYGRQSGYKNFQALADHFESIVWVNPILEREHARADGSGTIADVKKLLPMYDLTLRGLERAVTRLMEE